MKFKGEPSGACPTYFRAGCYEARNRLLPLNMGYDSPAWHLAIHLYCDLVYQEEAMEELEELVALEDDRGIAQWFRYYLPRCMKLVPSKRLPTFLKGFWQAVEDGRVF